MGANIRNQKCHRDREGQAIAFKRKRIVHHLGL